MKMNTLWLEREKERERENVPKTNKATGGNVSPTNNYFSISSPTDSTIIQEAGDIKAKCAG